MKLAIRVHRLSRCCLSTLAPAGVLSACTTLLPGTMPHNIERDATALERNRCDATPVDPRLYAAATVQKVEPYYRYSLGGSSGREAHFAGAELELRPFPGVTAELLERGLMCRSAQLMLGHAEGPPDEPYFLPHGWVKIDVQSGHGAFVVSLSSEDAERGHEVYDRARSFAGLAPLPQ